MGCKLSTSFKINDMYRLYFKSGAKKAYLSRSWYDFPIGTSRYPAEPILKMLLPFIGINAELWAGHVSYRYPLCIAMPFFKH